MAYLEGVRATYNYTFDLTGVHNERAFSRGWVIALRAALDAAGFAATRISVNDDTNSGCSDCQAYNDSSITTAAAHDPEFASAFDVIGLHSAGTLPKLAAWDWEKNNKSYIQSEANDVDGPLIETADGSFPQWAGNAGSPDGPGLEWPSHFISNYLNIRITGMIICPLSHAWTWVYGRHNHGTALFIRPWDGHYVLGAAFWTQAHITQAVRPGWRFLDGSASGSAAAAVFASFVSPSLDAFSVVAVNADGALPATLRFQLVGALAASFAGAPLATWVSNASQLFRQAADTPTDAASGSFSFTLGPRSVLTLTTLRTLSHVEPAVAPRAAFPLPYTNDFEAPQRLEEPGRLLSDLFGAFYIAADPLGERGQVLRQAVPAAPAAWLGRDGIPFTSLPGPGAVFANGNISASALLTQDDLPPVGGAAAAAVSICGRVPVWQPAYYASQTAHLGVCLWLFANGSYAVVDAVLGGAPDLTLAAGSLGASALGAWHALSLSFADDSCVASVDGAVVASVSGLRSASGAYGLGTLWHTASFDDLRLDASSGRPFTARSFLFDILPGERLVRNLTGWAGFALDLRAPGSAALSVAALGRFRARGNSLAHRLDIVDAATRKSVLAGGAVTVDFSSCVADAIGFCYGQVSPIATLAAGAVYFAVSEETAGGDAFVSMYDAAAATTHVHRDGTTMMSYMGPLMGAVTGAVSGADFASLAFDADSTIELANGPINLVLG